MKLFPEFKTGAKVRFISSVPTGVWNLTTGIHKQLRKGEVGIIVTRKIRLREGLKFLEITVLFDESDCKYTFYQTYTFPSPPKSKDIELV